MKASKIFILLSLSLFAEIHCALEDGVSSEKNARERKNGPTLDTQNGKQINGNGTRVGKACRLSNTNYLSI